MVTQDAAVASALAKTAGRVFLEETGPRPVLWVGSNHGASIVRVEPLD
jgi:hypothetical protein